MSNFFHSKRFLVLIAILWAVSLAAVLLLWLLGNGLSGRFFSRQYPVAVQAAQPSGHGPYGYGVPMGTEFWRQNKKFNPLARLYEDGQLLGPGDALHADIGTRGDGRFSLWTDGFLYFSSSDNSDPRTNGRQYTLVLPSYALIEWSLVILLTLTLILGFKFLQDFRSMAEIAKFIVRKRIIEIILFLLTFAISGYFSTIGVDPHHDGIMIKPAMDVASGQMLFRDTFTQYGALTTLLQAASLIIFGKYLITIKLLTAFFYGLISILLYLIFTRFIPKTIVFITVIVWILMAPYFVSTFLPWSSVYSLFFQLLGAYFLINSITKNSRFFLVLSGIATSLTFWCRQPVGVFMFLAIFVFFVFLYFLKQISFKELKNHLIIFVIGNFLVCLFFGFWLIANNAYKDWWLQSIIYPFGFATSTDVAGNMFTNIIRDLYPATLFPSLFSVWILLPLSTIFLLIKHSINLFYKSNDIKTSKILLALCFIGLASWLQNYPVPGTRHLYWAATPIFGLLSLFLYQFINRYFGDNTKIPAAIYKLATIILIVIAFYPDLIFRIKSGYAIIQQSYYSIDQPKILKYMRLSKPELESYKYIYSEIDSFLKNNPEGNVVALGRDALYLTFNPKIYNVQPMYILWNIPNPIYPDYFAKIFLYISENKPLILTDNLPAMSPDENYCQQDINGTNSPLLVFLPCK